MSVDCIELSKLLHPERLSTDELVKILESRCIKIKSMGGVTREQLLDLFRRVATPLEQRTNHRVQTNSLARKHRDIENTKCNDVSKMDYEAHAEVVLKRASEQTPDGPSPAKKTRQRICWP